jgi:glycine cleavage system regulatory protein
MEAEAVLVDMTIKLPAALSSEATEEKMQEICTDNQ